MKSTAIKKEIHNAIDIIDDKDFLKAIHLLLSEKSKQYTYDLNEDEKKELDSMRKEYKAGKIKTYTVAEVRTHAYSKLKR